MSYSLEEEFKLFKQILTALCQNHHKSWGQPLAAGRILEHWQRSLPALDKGKLLTLLRGAGEAIDSSANLSAPFLYLEPIHSKKQYIVPVMTFSCSVGSDVFHASIRLLLILEYGANYKAIGYRYETGEGVHDYCHVQHISQIDGTQKILMEQWLHEEVPAIPIDAGGPVGLLMCILGSLYGRNCTTKIPPGQIDFSAVRLSIAKMRPYFHKGLYGPES